MRRRRFDHFVVELSLAVGSRIPRYPLWLRVRESGLDPEELSRDDALAFCREHLRLFLAQQGLVLRQRQARRLARTIARYDPSIPTPEEHLERIHGA